MNFESGSNKLSRNSIFSCIGSKLGKPDAWNSQERISKVRVVNSNNCDNCVNKSQID